MLLYHDSFDFYNTSQITPFNWSTQVSLSGGPAIGAYGRYGTNGMHCTDSLNGVRLQLDANKTTLIAGVAWKLTAGTDVGSARILTFWLDGGVQMAVGYNVSNNFLTVIRGGSVIATSTYAAPVGSGPHFIEFKVTFATGATGSYELRVNGATILSGTSVITASGTAAANQVSLHNYAGGFNHQANYDDFYLCDNSGTDNNDFLGDCRSCAQLPAAAGTYSQFTPNAAGANYTKVNETAADDDTTYVADATVGDKDTYPVADLPVSTGSIFGVTTIIRAKKDDAGFRKVAPYVLQGTPAQGTSVAIADDYQNFRQVYERNPVTTNPWTVADINTNAELGFVVSA